MKFFLVCISTFCFAGRSRRENDCFDGLNGGCSHYCSFHECQCPECWELQADGKTCGPANEHLELTCSADFMQISVDECIYGSGQEVTLSFVDSTCSPTKSENGHWDASYHLDECGTNAFTENGMIKFENSLTVQSRAGSIIMHTDPELIFTCEFPAFIDGVSTNVKILGEETHTSNGANSDGSFEFNLDFVAPDSDGVFSVAPDDTTIVGERVYFDVTNKKPLDGLSFFVQECRISDTHGNEHNVVEDNCVDNLVTVTRETPFDSIVATSKARFSYIAFQFSGTPDAESATLELVCNIAVCLETECLEHINSCTDRRRRRNSFKTYFTSKTILHTNEINVTM